MASFGWQYKISYFGWWLGRCVVFAARGLASRAQNWAIAAAGAVGFFLDWLGIKMISIEGWEGSLVSGLVGVGAAWVLLFFARFIYALFFNFRDGEWQGDEFVYNKPQHAKHVYASAAINNKVHSFYFPDAPPHSLVKFKFEFDGRKEFISADVQAGWRALPEFSSHDELRFEKGSVRVGKYRRMWVTTFMRNDADPFSVRIYITGWKNDPGSIPPLRKSDKAPPAYFG